MTIIEADGWSVDAIAGEGPAYGRILSRLERDIRSGALGAGTRLPTQRTLADLLGVGLGTVTRAYAEAETRGLIEAVVGRGTFVAHQPTGPSSGLIDLGRNLPPAGLVSGALRQAFAALARRADLAQRIDYAPPHGFEADRRAGAAFLRRVANFRSADAARLMVTAGAQQAIAVALAAICRPGDTLIVEAATFHGVRLAAAQLGLKVAPVALDSEGLAPAALDRAAAESGARAAYVQPLQNPTARVMSLARRRELIAIARRRGLTLIEDDLYGPYVAELGLPPLAELAPEQVAYVSGLSKCLAPGLRTGFLIPPATLQARCGEALRAVAFGAPTLGPLVASHWIETGEAYALWDAVRLDMRRRFDLAKQVLAGKLEPLPQPVSPHVWLPLSELDAERVAGQALRAGVELTPPRAPFAPGVPVDGLRLCLGAAADLATLERGLRVVLAAMSPGASLGEAVV